MRPSEVGEPLSTARSADDVAVGRESLGRAGFKGRRVFAIAAAICPVGFQGKGPIVLRGKIRMQIRGGVGLDLSARVSKASIRRSASRMTILMPGADPDANAVAKGDSDPAKECFRSLILVPLDLLSPCLGVDRIAAPPQQ